MSKTVEFYFDLGSPATYLAYTQLPKICAQIDSQLIYIPILLGASSRPLAMLRQRPFRPRAPICFRTLIATPDAMTCR